MKKFPKYLSITLFLMLIILFGFSKVNAASNPYKEAGPYGTNCTWYAWKMVSEKAGVTLPGWGDAKKWYNDAKDDGYTVGTTPAANSIIVWGSWTSYGHVGYVERVEGNVMYIWDSTGPCIDREDPEFAECMANGVSEETDKICYANAKRIACEYTISPDEYGITGFIYLDIAPKKTSTSQNNTNVSKNEDSETTKVQKSSNNSLSNIELSIGNIEFDKEVLEYNLDVENEIENITINATVEDKLAKVEGIGEYNLNVGLNEIKLTVTAEDKSSKEYVIKITRKEEIKIEEEIEPDTNNKETEENIIKKDNHQTIVIALSVLFIIFIFCLLFIFKKKRGNKKIKSKKL